MLKLFKELQLAEKEYPEDGKWYTLEDVDKELDRIIEKHEKQD